MATFDSAYHDVLVSLLHRQQLVAVCRSHTPAIFIFVEVLRSVIVIYKDDRSTQNIMDFLQNADPSGRNSYLRKAAFYTNNTSTRRFPKLSSSCQSQPDFFYSQNYHNPVNLSLIFLRAHFLSSWCFVLKIESWGPFRRDSVVESLCTSTATVTHGIRCSWTKLYFECLSWIHISAVAAAGPITAHPTARGYNLRGIRAGQKIKYGRGVTESKSSRFCYHKCYTYR